MWVAIFMGAEECWKPHENDKCPTEHSGVLLCIALEHFNLSHDTDEQLPNKLSRWLVIETLLTIKQASSADIGVQELVKTEMCLRTK